MRRLVFSLSAILTLLAVLATACGGGTVAPTAATPTVAQPTPTPLPATDTPIPPTSAPVQPTSAPAQPTSASGGPGLAGGILSSALTKAQAATVYRLDMQISGQGAFGMALLAGTPTADSTPAPASNQPFTLFSISGAINNKDADLTMNGFFAAFLGADPNTGLELITAGGKSYIHGPVQLLGATDAKWYELPAPESATIQPPLTPNNFLQSLSKSSLGPSDFTQSGTESLDNQSCDVFVANQDALQKGFTDLGQSANGNSSNEVIDSGDFRFWICGDGYLHQVKLTVQGHNKDNPSQTGQFNLLMHIYDINANIQIQAPANAEPLNVPSFLNPGTPTP